MRMIGLRLVRLVRLWWLAVRRYSAVAPVRTPVSKGVVALGTLEGAFTVGSLHGPHAELVVHIRGHLHVDKMRPAQLPLHARLVAALVMGQRGGDEESVANLAAVPLTDPVALGGPLVVVAGKADDIVLDDIELFVAFVLTALLLDYTEAVDVDLEYSHRLVLVQEMVVEVEMDA